MELKESPGGWRYIEHELHDGKTIQRLLAESSTVGHDDDSLDNPGSSYLLIANEFHLNRAQARFLAITIFDWLINKRLPTHIDAPAPDPEWEEFDESELDNQT